MPKRGKMWEASVLILIFSGIIVIYSRTIAEVDLWGHLLWGQVILENRQLVRVDPFSYLTAGYPWTNHQWLGDVLMAWLWAKTGASGLLLLKLAAWLGLFGLALAWLVRRGLPVLRAGLLVILSGILLNGYAISIRPQIFTLLGYALLLLVLLQAETGRTAWLWGLPALFALWANLHGGWLVGLGLCGLWGAVFLLSKRQTATWLAIAPPLLASALATLATPYGLELWRFLLEHLAEARWEIAEWQPLALHSRFGWAYAVWLGLVIAGLVANHRTVSPARLALLAAAAYLPWMAQRHMLFFALGALFLVGPEIGQAWLHWMPDKAPLRPRPTWFMVTPLIAAGLLLGLRPPNFTRIPFPDAASYPVAATALLKQSGAEASLANAYNWGNYLSWHLGPSIQVAIDTRREQAYPSEAYTDSLRFLTGSPGWERLLEKYPTDLVLIDPGSTTNALLQLSPGWEVVFQDQASRLYARRGTALANQLKNNAARFTPPTPPTSFP